MFKYLKDMPLKKKFQVTILLVITGFIVMATLVQRYVVYRSFINFEQKEAVKDLNRGLQAIDREIYHLRSISHEWGSWDDAYIFVQNHNMEFIKSNLYYPSFISANLNIICFLDRNKKIVFTGGFELKTGSKMLPVFFQNGDTIRNSGLLNFETGIPESEQNRSGMLLTESGVIVISARPVLSSKNTGPSKGYIIMGRLLNESVIHKLKEQTKVDFKIITADKPAASGDASVFKDLISSVNNSTMIYQSSKIILYSIYTDVFGKPAFLFRTDYPRNIKTEGIKIVTISLMLLFLGSVVLILILFLVIKYSVTKPVEILKKQVESIVTGDYSPDKILRNSDELGMLSGVIDNMAGTINRKTTELEDVNRVLELLTITDSLTSAYNRRIFDETIRHEWERAARAGENLSLIMCDIDYFKKYNDMYGHQAGDEILIKVAGALRKPMKRMTDRVYRYGGEEFVIMLHGTGQNGCLHVAELLLISVRSLKVLHEFSDAADTVTISIGCTTVIPDKNKDFSYLVSLADKALYDAKDKGRNRICSAEVTGDGSVSFVEHQVPG